MGVNDIYIYSDGIARLMNTRDKNGLELNVDDIVLHWGEEWVIIEIRPMPLSHQTAFAIIKNPVNGEEQSWPCNVLTKKEK